MHEGIDFDEPAKLLVVINRLIQFRKGIVFVAQLCIKRRKVIVVKFELLRTRADFFEKSLPTIFRNDLANQFRRFCFSSKLFRFCQFFCSFRVAALLAVNAEQIVMRLNCDSSRARVCSRAPSRRYRGHKETRLCRELHAVRQGRHRVGSPWSRTHVIWEKLPWRASNHRWRDMNNPIPCPRKLTRNLEHNNERYWFNNIWRVTLMLL